MLAAGDFDRIEKPKAKGALTFEDFAMQWVRGELAAKYPDHVERKRSAYTDLCNLRKYVFPALDGKAIADVELDDYERVMREIPTRAGERKLRSSTRRHVAQVMRRVMQLAEYPAKVIARNPIPANALPKKRTRSRSSTSTPTRTRRSSAAPRSTTNGKPKVDLGHRVLYGFLTRAGWRREEALGGKVEEVDDAVEDAEQALEEVPRAHLATARPVTASCTWTARRPGALGPSRSIRTSCAPSRPGAPSPLPAATTTSCSST